VPAVLALAALALLALRRGGSTPPATRPSTGPILADRAAQAVALYFGLQALSFYAMLTWLPTILRDDAGLTTAASGALVAAAAVLGAPAALVLPGRVARSSSQPRWVVAVTLPIAVALLGLLLAPGSAPVLWALLYGLGTGMGLPLGMVLMLLRTRDVAQTGRLSAAAQSSGYLLAATGPLGVGLLHDATAGWTLPLLVLLLVLVVQTAAGLSAARPRLVTDRAAHPR
jgi:MFS transporter, CP family, cyanate transporter